MNSFIEKKNLSLIKSIKRFEHTYYIIMFIHILNKLCVFQNPSGITKCKILESGLRKFNRNAVLLYGFNKNKNKQYTLSTITEYGPLLTVFKFGYCW